ncbi:MAG: putative transport system permease protein, partial [Mucilaginibacter sp.]|nr:putative transport system permease protein [Mucilaginibacter sp.]
MNLDDHVWNLASKKLANEASEKELRELNALLDENPELHSQLKLMSKWWDDGEEKPKNDSSVLFGRIQAKIKDIESAIPSEVTVDELSITKQVKAREANYNSTK